MSTIAKRLRAKLCDLVVEVEVSLEHFTDDELIDELQARNILDSDDAEILKDGKSLDDYYSDKYDSDCDCAERGSEPDDAALTIAQAAIRSGDMSEALLQISRILPELADLQHLAERRGLIRHGG